MIIRMTKAKNKGKQDRLTCVRDDGSQTSWPLSAFFAQHDLLHYVVETTLGLEEAFFGLIARGRDINSFGTRDGQKDTYTRDEAEAELIVGLFQAQMRGGDLQNYAEFWEMLAVTCQKINWTLSHQLSEEQFLEISNKINELEAKWKALRDGESMELFFT